ncbi:MAG: hypothetical protein RIS76_2974 [Verrucomicrobiota bacterium]
MGQAHLTAVPRDLPMAAPIAAHSAGHSLASASAASVVEVGGLAAEHEGEDDPGVGHGRGSPGKGGHGQGHAGQPDRPTGNKKKAGADGLSP